MGESLTLTKFAIVITLVVYISAFAFYGDEIFDNDWSPQNDCTGFFDCLGDALAGIIVGFGDLLQFITLTGIPEVPLIMELFLKFIVGLPWLIIFIGLGRGTAAS